MFALGICQSFKFILDSSAEVPLLQEMYPAVKLKRNAILNFLPLTLPEPQGV